MGALFFIGLAACVLGTLLSLNCGQRPLGWGIVRALVPFLVDCFFCWLETCETASRILFRHRNFVDLALFG